jgi:predicted nucleic acid-binding Zn ribbon protein
MPSSCQGLLSQVDGRHIPIQEQDKRSFAALSAMVGRPEPMPAIDHHQRHSIDTTCVVSARDDHLHRLKTYLIKAARKQGMAQETTATAVAEGVKHCWAVWVALHPYGGTLEGIVDWCHRAQQLRHGKKAVGEAFATS